MFRRARPTEAAATPASATAAKAPERRKARKKSWAAMTDRVRQHSERSRFEDADHEFEESVDLTAVEESPQEASAAAVAEAPASEPAPNVAADSASSDEMAPAAEATASDGTDPAPSAATDGSGDGSSPVLAQAVRRALNGAETPDQQHASESESQAVEPESAETASKSASSPAGQADQAALRPASAEGSDSEVQTVTRRRAADGQSLDRNFGQKQPAVAQATRNRAANALLGHTISVAGSSVWAVLDPGGTIHAEIGAMVRLQGSQMRSFGIITSLRSEGERRDDRRLVEIKLLGEMAEGNDRFQRGVSSHPALDSPIHMASREELQAVFARPDRPTVRLGSLHQASDLPAYAMTDNLLGKHFAVLGTTGAGKSCSVTVILRSILEANPHGHIIMLDPHNEYGPAFQDQAELLNPSNLKLPYWLLNFEEIAEVLVSKDSPERAYAESAILRRAILDARRGAVGQDVSADHITVDTPSPFRLSELIRLIKEAMAAFNNAEGTAPYQHLISRIESVTSDKRFDFMFSSFMVSDTMSTVLSRILRIPIDGKPVTIIDLSGVPSEIVDVTVSVLCRLVFEFALWSERDKAPPVLLVCEEAHRYVPRDDSAAFAPTKRSISRIAKEGRKYGLGLCLVTQRPAELSISSLSQCNTIFALRLGNEDDLTFVRHAIPDSARWLTDAMPALNTGEAVVIGDGVPVPMHIRFDELAPEHRPASTTPAFSSAWQADDGDHGLIEETIERWRYQLRGDREAS